MEKEHINRRVSTQQYYFSCFWRPWDTVHQAPYETWRDGSQNSLVSRILANVPTYSAT